MEAGVVIDRQGKPLFWHLPAGSTLVSLPDSQDLWARLFENRAMIGGFAHSHPGNGVPRPSQEDLTTFSAVERGLGVCLDWWITSANALVCVRRSGPFENEYRSELHSGHPSWLEQLRVLSEEIV